MLLCHGSLHHRLGCHVQWACSFEDLDRPPSALVLRCATSKCCYEASTFWSVWITLRQLRTSPIRVFCAPIKTRPPSSPMESEAFEVASCHLHSGPDQLCIRQAIMTACASGRMETPSPGGPADMETLWSCTGRPVWPSRHVPLPALLFTDRGNPQHGCTVTQLVPGPTQICVSPSEPTYTDTVQRSGRIRSRSC